VAPRLPDPLWDVVRALAGSKLDDANVREAMPAERIFFHDGGDVLRRFANGQNDPTDARYLPPGDEEIPRGVVLLEERDMGGHVRVNLGEGRLVGEFDHEHGLLQGAGIAGGTARQLGNVLEQDDVV